MIAPLIHHSLRRSDLTSLVHEIRRTDPQAAQPAAQALEEGRIDGLLDSPAALDAVLGHGGPPAPLPLTLLWYIPIRALLRDRDIADVELADFTATLPVVFSEARASRSLDRGARGIAGWWRAIEALPSGTVGQGERAAECGALALWWAGCFPEALENSGGRGMVRAYEDFASHTMRLAGRALAGRVPACASLYERAAARVNDLGETLREVRQDYLGPDATDPEGRLDRMLQRLRRRMRFDH